MEVIDNPFAELFIERRQWKFSSSSSNKIYTVSEGASGNIFCDCWGYRAHKNCKHIKEIFNQI
tara:strand:+ start:1273 stop:1461 length:189 start_codon:yes stop_codon:yes gene_type:complete